MDEGRWMEKKNSYFLYKNSQLEIETI